MRIFEVCGYEPMVVVGSGGRESSSSWAARRSAAGARPVAERPIRFVNLRETAGWSRDGAAAAPKLSALIAAAQLPAPAPVGTVSYRSAGRVLVLGPADGAERAVRLLADRLEVVQLIDPVGGALPQVREHAVHAGRLTRLQGWLGAFEAELGPRGAAVAIYVRDASRPGGHLTNDVVRRVKNELDDHDVVVLAALTWLVLSPGIRGVPSALALAGVTLIAVVVLLGPLGALGATLGLGAGEIVLAVLAFRAVRRSLDELGDGVAATDFGDGVSIGDTVEVEDPISGAVSLPVTAVLDFSFDTLTLGYVVSPETLAKIAPTAATGPSLALLKVDPDRRAAIAKELKQLGSGYGNVQITAGNIVGQVIETVFDFLINAINGLLGMSIVIALIGIVNTLTLSIFERRRELGLLRAVGMTATSVRRMIRLEAVQMALLGTIIGIASGLLLGFLLLRASDLGSLDIQWDRMGLLLVLGVLLGMLAAIAPTRRVTKLNVLESIEVT